MFTRLVKYLSLRNNILVTYLIRNAPGGTLIGRKCKRASLRYILFHIINCSKPTTSMQSIYNYWNMIIYNYIICIYKYTCMMRNISLHCRIRPYDDIKVDHHYKNCFLLHCYIIMYMSFIKDNFSNVLSYSKQYF